jgi:hypothetical protein
MKSLVLNFAVEAHNVNIRAASNSAYDSNILRTQAKQSGTLRQANSPRKRVATSDSTLYFSAEKIRMADELRRIRRCGMAVYFAWRRHLFQFAHAQERNSVRHDHGFLLVMGHKHE